LSEDDYSSNTQSDVCQNNQTLEFGQTLSRQKRPRVKSEEVVQFAVENWNKYQTGITYLTLVKHFGNRLKEPQQKLKVMREHGLIFTNPFKRFQIQEYYPTSLQSEIQPVLQRRYDAAYNCIKDNGRGSKSPVAILLEEQRSKHFLQVLQSAEPPLCIHKLLFITSIEPEYYDDVQQRPQEGNLNKTHSEYVGRCLVTQSAKMAL